MARGRDEEPRPQRKRRRRRRRGGEDGKFKTKTSTSGWEPQYPDPPAPAAPAVPPVPPVPPVAPSEFLTEAPNDFDESLLSSEERAYAKAHRIADEKIKLSRDAVKFGLLSIPFFIFGLTFVGLILLAVGCVRVGRRYYRISVEPQLRERFVEEEVNKQVHESVTEERQHLAGEHARTLEQLSASIAHEIRNPITAAKSLVQQMEEDPTSRENTEYARVAVEELQRVERSVSHLLRFARDEEMGLAEVSLADVIDSALETFRDRLQRNGVELDSQLDSEGRMRGDPEQLRRVVINLVGNAIDALEESGTPDARISVTMGENLAGTDVWVRVRDNGPGIADEVRDRLFSPFYTSKQSGTGLGLAISKKVVDAHGGSMEANSSPGSGAEFLLTFPKHAENGDG